MLCSHHRAKNLPYRLAGVVTVRIMHPKNVQPRVLHLAGDHNFGRAIASDSHTGASLRLYLCFVKYIISFPDYIDRPIAAAPAPPKIVAQIYVQGEPCASEQPVGTELKSRGLTRWRRNVLYS
jgi:hypothetical protein